jgi:hypothetical protein
MNTLRNFLTSGIVALLLVGQSFAGTITGPIQNPAGGPVANGTLTFNLTQSAVISGTATLVTGPVSCFTDANGNVVGEPNPLVAPAISSNLASGTLAAGTYFVKLTYLDATGQTVASPETSFTMTGTGTLIVSAPVKQPVGVTKYNVYVSTSSGTETLQGSVTVSSGSWGSYSQSSALVVGAALPSSNTTVCTIHFNDEMQPSFVCYDVGLTGQNGTTLPGYPQFWYLFGGSAGTVNVSIGTPQSNVCQGAGVFYPQPIYSQPPGNATQSINGGLNLGNFPFSAGPVTAGSASITNTGVFTNTQMNLYDQSLIGGCSPLTEFQRGQTPNFSTDAGTFCNKAPVGSTVLQANGIGAYAVSSTNPGSPSTFAGTPVGIYAQATCLADNCQTFAENPVAEDDGLRTAGVSHHGLEIDIGEQSVNTAYSAIYGINTVIQGNGAGNVTNSWAYVASTRSPGSHLWNIGFWSANNSATNAFVSGAACAAGNCNSQGLRFDAMAASVIVSSKISGDNSGNLQLAPLTGKNANLFGGLAASEVSTPPVSGTFDVLWGDSTAHRLTMSNNGGSAVTVGTMPLYTSNGTEMLGSPHMVQDTCTLGTNCGVTFSGSAAFTSATTYSCACHDQTTPLNACGVNQTGGAGITITGTGTDVIRYLCAGN